MNGGSALELEWCASKKYERVPDVRGDERHVAHYTFDPNDILRLIPNNI